MAGKVKGPAIFLAQFAGDAAPFNSFDAICRLGGVARLQGRADPDLGRPAVRPEEGGVIQDLLRRDQGHGRGARPRDHRTLDPSAGPARRGQSGLRRRLRRLRADGGARQPPKRAGVGGRADDDGRQGLAATSASTPMRRFSGALRLALSSIPGRSAPPGLIETAFDELARRWKPILDAFDDAGVDVGYEIHPGEDVFDGATFEMFLERAATTSAATSSTIPRISCCSSSTISPSSTSTTSASRRSTSRTPSSIRPGGRASIAAMPVLGEPRRAASVRSATARSISAASSPSSRNTAIRRLGGARMGMLPQASRGRRARGAPFIAHHIIRVTEKAFDDFAGSGDRQAADQARCSACAERERRHGSRDAATRGRRRQDPARHGGRRRGRLHRRRASARRAHGRPL